MKNFICNLIAPVILLTGNAVAAEDQERPPQSVEPFENMQKLSPLTGKWTLSLSSSFDGGASWTTSPDTIVNVDYRLKELALSEIPAIDGEGPFELESYIAYDQYRDVYRMMALDDTWGVPDVYEGQVNGDELILTNIRSGTNFPLESGGYLVFRLTYKLSVTDGVRTMQVESSSDQGESWGPMYKAIYTKIVD